MSKNVRVHLSFWIAIPIYLLVAAVWTVVGTVYVVGYLLVQGFRLSAIGIDNMIAGHQVRRAAPDVRGAPDIAVARTTAVAAAGQWCGPVQNIRRGWGPGPVRD
jgi:hypothetical protein